VLQPLTGYRLLSIANLDQSWTLLLSCGEVVGGETWYFLLRDLLSKRNIDHRSKQLQPEKNILQERQKSFRLGASFIPDSAVGSSLKRSA
jgi:hypothetical protein